MWQLLPSFPDAQGATCQGTGLLSPPKCLHQLSWDTPPPCPHACPTMPLTTAVFVFNSRLQALLGLGKSTGKCSAICCGNWGPFLHAAAMPGLARGPAPDIATQPWPMAALGESFFLPQLLGPSFFLLNPICLVSGAVAFSGLV